MKTSLKLAGLLVGSSLLLAGCSAAGTVTPSSTTEPTMAPTSQNDVVPPDQSMTPAPTMSPAPSAKVEDEKTLQSDLNGTTVDGNFNTLVK